MVAKVELPAELSQKPLTLDRCKSKMRAKLSLYKISQQFAGQLQHSLDTGGGSSTLEQPARPGRTQVDWKRKLSPSPFITPAGRLMNALAARTRVRDLSIESPNENPVAAGPEVAPTCQECLASRRRVSSLGARRHIFHPSAEVHPSWARLWTPDGARLLTCCSAELGWRARRQLAGRRDRRRDSTGGLVA